MPFTTIEKDGCFHIEFERTDGTRKLVDAIIVSSFQYGLWTENDIAQLIEQRWQNYLIAITPPPEPVPPEGFEFKRDEYGMIVRNENGELVLVAVGEE